jgi:hypothetical protein
MRPNLDQPSAARDRDKKEDERYRATTQVMER